MEVQVPEKAGKAFRAAYRRALKEKLYVLIVERGKLIEVSPDLKRREIRSVAHSANVAKGTIYKIVRPSSSPT